MSNATNTHYPLPSGTWRACAANMALYAAARKAGFEADLARVQAEIIKDTSGVYHFTFDHEMTQVDGFVVPFAALERAARWTERYAVKWAALSAAAGEAFEAEANATERRANGCL